MHKTIFFQLAALLLNPCLALAAAAGGDAAQLMGPMAQTLTAISAGAVFMGSNSYIGNAPNFMVRAIAEAHGVTMPSFFGYMLWSCGILVPLFIILSWLVF